MAHRLIWPLLAIGMVLGFTLALVWRPPPDQDASRSTTTQASR